MIASYVNVAWDECMNLANWRVAMEWKEWDECMNLATIG